MITLLPAADRVAVPWKNGGGITREVAVFPPGAGMDAFDWRVSMAEVRDSGPFSPFSGIDRNLTVLEGRLRLEMGGETLVLEPGEKLAFAGDVPVHATPLRPVVDLNVMTRRSHASAQVTSISALATVSNGLLIVLSPQVVAGFALAPFDALRIRDETISAHGLWVEFKEVMAD